MAPDSPVRIRPLTVEEQMAEKNQLLRLGSMLSDGFIVVDRRLANAAKVGEREIARRRRKIADRSRARNRR